MLRRPIETTCLFGHVVLDRFHSQARCVQWRQEVVVPIVEKESESEDLQRLSGRLTRRRGLQLRGDRTLPDVQRMVL